MNTTDKYFYSAILNPFFLSIPTIALLFLLFADKQLYIFISKIGIFFQFYFFYKKINNTEFSSNLINNLKKSTEKKKIAIASILLPPITLFSFIFLDKDPSYCNGCTTNNYLGMIIYYTFCPIVISLIFYLSIVNFKHRKIIFNIN